MTLIRDRSSFSYRSLHGGVTYTFNVVMDASGNITIMNVVGPTASTAPCSTACATNLPEGVLEDMLEARGLVELLLSETEVTFGTLTFTGQTQQTASIPAGLLNNTNYRVAYTDPCGTVIYTENKTLLSFDAVVGVTYGSPTNPIDVQYSVLVHTAQNSPFGGSVTFTVADSGTKDVVFPTEVSTTSYRVLLTPDGFFVPRVINQTTTGFTIQLGHGLLGAETATVGFDVFV